jgi:tetratricopeptide (TPR) repeat protein
MVPTINSEGKNLERKAAMSLVTHKYTPSEMSDDELRATFAARGHTVDYLVKSLRDQIHSGTLSSFVITAPRGAGKSTVIHMVALRIREDSQLRSAWIPVVFPEEQFDVASLRDLLAALLRALSSADLPNAKAWLAKVAAEPNDEQSQQLAITGLKEITRQARKRLVVFVENLNLLLEECLDDQMKGTLRRLLMSDPFMMIIGSSVHVFDSLKKYDEAFFNYFGQVPLDRLKAEQVFELLKLRARFDGNEPFLRDFPKQQPKIRAIVQLSGGNPRLVLMLYELLSQRKVTTIVQYLRRLVDELTPLLKDEMENLPPQQRKIIHALMEKGGTAKPSELVEPTRLPLNAINTQLKRLKDAQIVELLGGGKGRAANYTVPDKLFAIWYQMRYLGQNRRRIELFVEVLRVWFEEEERLQMLRGLGVPAESDGPLVLRERATTAEYFAASFRGTTHQQVATDLCVNQWLKADMREAALAYADLVNSNVTAESADETTAHTKLARWLSDHGSPQQAIEALDQIIAKGRSHESSYWEALQLRGTAKSAQGDLVGAITDFTTAIELDGASKEQVAWALANRGITKSEQGDVVGAIADYSTIIELEGGPKEYVAWGLGIRGLAKGQQGDVAGEIADYTTAIELDGAPEQVVALSFIQRGDAKCQQGDVAGAIADYTTAIELDGVSKQMVAKSFVNRGVVKGQQGDLAGAIADCTSAIELDGAPKEYVAWALVNRGGAKGQQRDIAGAIADYTTAIELDGASKEGIARALINRGVTKQQQGEAVGAIADFSMAIELGSAPKEPVARALVGRGIARHNQGDVVGAIADFTTAIKLDGAPKERVATALITRGITKAQHGDVTGAIADYTAAIELDGAPKMLAAQALFSRAMAFEASQNVGNALTDFVAVLDLAVTRDNLLSDSARMAASLAWRRSDREQVRLVLRKFSAATAKLPRDVAREESLRFLSSLASPEMKDAWPFAWQTLAENQEPEIAAALEFLRPVCAILEGQDRVLLDALPPEQREFALSVLARFDKPNE